MQTLDPSRKLLCQLVTGVVPPSDPRLQPATWEHLYPIAQREGLAPLLYWQLQKSGWPASLPETICSSLTEMYYASIAHNTLLFSELEKIIPIFKAHHIPTVLLKGASLAPALYPGRGLRPMVDVDCLLLRSDYPLALQLLKDLGYQVKAFDQVPGLHDMSDYHTGLSGGPGQRVICELHWGLVSTPLAWYAAPLEWFWEHTEPWSLAGDALQLTPTAHLVYLSAHALLQHGGSQLILIWLYDMHLLSISGLVDWDQLVESVVNLRWGGVVAQALRQAKAAFDTALPTGILDRLDQVADPAVDRLVAFKQRFGGVRLLYDWYSLMALRGLPRLRYALGMIFPSPAYLCWRYTPRPTLLWPFYYPYRLLRMVFGGILALKHGILRAVR